jgi:hypothetical protein
MTEKLSRWLDETETADYIDMSVAFLRKGRITGMVGNRTPAPPHHKIGASIKYDRADLDAWLADRRVDPAARRAGRAAAGNDSRATPKSRAGARPKRQLRTAAAAA